MTTHYSRAQDPESLYDWAKSLIKNCEEEGIDVARFRLLYSGMSGVATATALSIAIYNHTAKTVGMVYVRKEHEKSHGSPTENNISVYDEPPILVFVDDFICDGNTINYVYGKYLEEYKNYRLTYAALHCRGHSLFKIQMDPITSKFNPF